MRILVLGSYGLIGKNLKDFVRGDNDNEWFFAGRSDANLLVLSEVEKLFDKFKPTHVINLTAMLKECI